VTGPSPPARQKPPVVQDTVERPATADGTTDGAHVRPPSVLWRAAVPAGPGGSFDGQRATAVQTETEAQATASSGSVDAGTAAVTQDAPAFSETRATAAWELPPAPRPTEMHDVALVHVTAAMSVTPAGSEPGAHKAPPSLLVRTSPRPPDPDARPPGPASGPE
jgi:hypothetical protein